MKPFVRLILALALPVALVACAGESAQWTAAPIAQVAVASPETGPVTTAAPDAAPAGTEAPMADATATTGGDAAAATEAPEGDAGDPTGDVLGTLEVRAFDLGFEPTAPSVPAAGRYLVRLVNDGAIFHDITFDDGTVIGAEAGQTAEAEVDIPAAGLGFICSVPGHGPAGMTGAVSVEAAEGEQASGEAAQGSTDDHGGPAPEADVAANPDAAPPVVHDPHAPPLLEGHVHDIELVMTEETMTVAEGFEQQVWTFGGTVPGPVIRVKVGDTIRVRLVNPVENGLSHSIDFHSSQVAWDDEMRSIAPGEELVYEWTADYAGVWMYHCGTAPALHHIANGMYGMVIVEPAEGLAAADRELALVQSEWYLGPQGEPSSLEKAMAAAPAPDYVVFNGVANQYRDTPIDVVTGERVRVFVLNAGPSVDSSFHIVGTIFDTVIKEGVQLQPGNPGSWGSQAVDLAPAQGAIVEFATAEDGLYPIVTHAFNFVGRGALGLLSSGPAAAADRTAG